MDIAASHQQWLEEITGQLKPNYKTIEELENHLVKAYGATPLELTKERLRFVEQEIVLRHYTEAGKQKIPMDIAAYTFPLTEEDTCLGTFTLVLERITEEIYHLDFATAKGQGQNPIQTKVNAAMKDILLYQGLTQEDIEKRTHRFLRYVSTLCYYGNPPSDHTA